MPKRKLIPQRRERGSQGEKPHRISDTWPVHRRPVLLWEHMATRVLNLHSWAGHPLTCMLGWWLHRERLATLHIHIRTERSVASVWKWQHPFRLFTHALSLCAVLEDCWRLGLRGIPGFVRAWELCEHPLAGCLVAVPAPGIPCLWVLDKSRRCRCGGFSSKSLIFDLVILCFLFLFFLIVICVYWVCCTQFSIRI